jgi:hypothetical protein
MDQLNGARVLGREEAAAYLGISVRTLDRLIATGAVSQVRFPVARARNGAALSNEVNRRVLLDRVELDRLVDRSRLVDVLR